MTILVRIPTPLRKITQGQDKTEIEATSIAELIDNLDKQFEGFKSRLLDDEGKLKEFINIYLNGEDIRFLKGLETVTKSRDEVSIVPAVAGG
tara:strand:+ start:260 stop:535 length:276 start_codon:yes stop_codon:yes gene_type:complete